MQCCENTPTRKQPLNNTPESHSHHPKPRSKSKLHLSALSVAICAALGFQPLLPAIGYAGAAPADSAVADAKDSLSSKLAPSSSLSLVPSERRSTLTSLPAEMPVGAQVLSSAPNMPTMTLSWADLDQQPQYDGTTLSGDTLTVKTDRNREIQAKAVLRVSYNNWSKQPADTVTLSIPKKIFSMRNNNKQLVGSIALPKIYANGGNSRWRVSEFESEYVLTNRVPFTGSSAADLIEFTFCKVKPIDIKDSFCFSKNVNATIIGEDGTVRYASSNSIKIQLDTKDNISAAALATDKTHIYQDGKWPSTALLPAHGGAPSDYVLVEYISSVTRNGSQHSSLSANFSLPSTTPKGTLLAATSNGKCLDITDPSNIPVEAASATRSNQISYYVMYDRTTLNDNTAYKYRADVTYVSTDIDDEETSTKSATCRITHTCVPKKNDNANHRNPPSLGTNKPTQGSPSKPTPSWAPPRRDGSSIRHVYTGDKLVTSDFLLEQIFDSQDIHPSFNSTYYAETLLYTRNGISANTQNDYNKVPVKVSGGISGYRFQNADLDSSAFSLDDVTIGRPMEYTYDGIAKKYEPKNFQTSPKISLYAIVEEDDNPKEELIAELQWEGKNGQIACSTSFSVVHGAYYITMPENCIGYRWDATLPAECSGIYMNVKENYTVKASAKAVVDELAELKDNVNQFKAPMSTTAALNIEPIGGILEPAQRTETARAFITRCETDSSLSESVSATERSAGGFDVSAELHFAFETNAKKPSDYKSVAYPDTGTLYVLLPAGVTVNTSNIGIKSVSGSSSVSLGKIKKHYRYDKTSRTLLEIPVTIRKSSANGEKFRLFIQAFYSYSSYAAYGGKLDFPAAFVSQSGKLSNSRDLAELDDYHGLRNLSESPSDQCVYAYDDTFVNTNLALAIGLSKTVSAGEENSFDTGLYDAECNVRPGGCTDTGSCSQMRITNP